MLDKQETQKRNLLTKIYPILPIRITYQPWVNLKNGLQSSKVSYFDAFMKEQSPQQNDKTKTIIGSVKQAYLDQTYFERKQVQNIKQGVLSSSSGVKISEIRKNGQQSIASLNNTGTNLQNCHQNNNKSLSEFNIVQVMSKTMQNSPQVQRSEKQFINYHQYLQKYKQISTQKNEQLIHNAQGKRTLNDIIEDLSKVKTVRIGLTIKEKLIMISDIKQ